MPLPAAAKPQPSEYPHLLQNLFEFFVLLLLIAFNGLCAMTELAVVSSRQINLEQKAKEGSAAAKRVLKLLESPGDFLATVQVCITLVGILAGAFGGVAMADALAPLIAQVNLLAPYADKLAFGAVVIVVTYLSLIIGELVPKQIALAAPERVAMAVSGPTTFFLKATLPLVRLISLSTRVVLKLLGIADVTEEVVTEDQIRSLLRQGARTGLLHSMEHQMFESVFRIGDRRVSGIMKPRSEVPWVRTDATRQQLLDTLERTRLDLVLVCDGNLDNVQGVVHFRSMLTQLLSGHGFDLKHALVVPLFVPAGMTALRALEMMCRADQPCAVVVDEYGGLEGLVTLDNLIETLLGDTIETEEAEEQRLSMMDDGAYFADGLMHMDKLCDLLEIPVPDEFRQGDYVTLGGFVMSNLGHMPHPDESFEFAAHQFTVISMDENRVDRVRIVPPVPIMEPGPPALETPPEEPPTTTA